MAKVTNLKVALQKGTTNTVFATWAFTNKNVKNYKITWSYYTGNNVWFAGSTSNITVKQAIYNVPSNATSVKVTVTPISKTYNVKVSSGPNKKHIIKKGKTKTVTKSYFKGVAVSKTFKMPSTKDYTPEKPSAPTLTDTTNKNGPGYKITATLENIQDSKTNKIQFQFIYEHIRSAGLDGSYTECITNIGYGTSKIDMVRRASFIMDLDRNLYGHKGGYKYWARCRAINVVGGKELYSGWSEYSNELILPPTPSAYVRFCWHVSNESSIAVYFDLDEYYIIEIGKYCTGVEIEYTINKQYFDASPSDVNALSLDYVPMNNTSPAYITGLEMGKTYYVRCSIVNEGGKSKWYETGPIIIGSLPEAPTTWSSTTTAIISESVTLYWLHNCEDNSGQSGAEIELNINGKVETKTVGSVKVGQTSSYSLNLSNYKEDAEILWRVRTKGIKNKYGPWSIQRMIKIYAQPTLYLNLGDDNLKPIDPEAADEAETNLLTSFPYIIMAIPGPDSQKPVSYHISITSEETYHTDNNIDEDDDGVYYEPGFNTWVSAGEEVYSKVFNVSNNPLILTLSAGDVSLQNNQLYKVTATVAMDSGLTAEASDTFTVSWKDESFEPDASIAIIWDSLTASISPFCRDEEENLVQNVTLGVYRREYDGSFTELGSELPNDGSITITDPHPALDYARYRITVRSEATGSVSFEDLPGEPILESSVVIQWDESWTPFDFSEDDPAEIPPWTGSMVQIPWNVDIDESHEPDVSLVEYMGRKHPVSYYGTQRGESASWSVEIDKTDKETIYALRRLSAWAGDVYVREPSGIGYWAHVTVSMSINHCELAVPVSFNITRVEGGK